MKKIVRAEASGIAGLLAYIFIGIPLAVSSLALVIIAIVGVCIVIASPLILLVLMIGWLT